MDDSHYLRSTARVLPMLDTLDRKLRDIAYHFGDVDATVDSFCDDIILKVDELRQYINEMAAEKRQNVRAELMGPHRCPTCGKKIHGPVYFRHIKRCSQTDLAAVWDETPLRTAQAE